MPSIRRPSAPWDAFLTDTDAAVETPTRLDCIGGFVVTELYGLIRATIDLDLIELAPGGADEAVMNLGCLGGPLYRKHSYYIDRVGVAAVPENYY